jgi:two-component system cell cycle response regulator
MDTPSVPPSLVERKKYDEKQAHQIARGVWWVGYIDARITCAHNPFLFMDGDEAVLINPGSRADEHFRTVRDKVSKLIDPRQIRHIVILHHDPDRCASLPLFEKLADRNVKIYAPSPVVKSIAYYGCKNPVNSLDDGDSIILKSGRTIDYTDTPDLPMAGMGLLYDSVTATVFAGNLIGRLNEEWNLYASTRGWESLLPYEPRSIGNKKAHLKALNKIERLTPDRICPHCGPIIEDDIDKYIEAARELDLG